QLPLRWLPLDSILPTFVSQRATTVRSEAAPPCHSGTYVIFPDFFKVAIISSWHLSQAAFGDIPPVNMSCILVPRLSASATNSGTGARIQPWNEFLSTRSSTVLNTGCCCCNVGSLISETRG